MTNQKKKNRTLKLKIILMALSIIVFASTSISTLVYLKTTKNNKENVISTVEDKVDIINERLNALTDNTIRIGNLLADSNVLRSGLTPAEEDELYAKLGMFQKEYPEIVNLIFNRYDHMYVYPRNAEVEAQLATLGAPCEKEYYKNRASEQEDSNWTATYVDDATGEWIVTYYQKVYENGQHIGFIEIDLSLAHIKDLVNSINMSQHIGVMITDYDGLINMSTHGELQNTTIDNAELLNFAKSNETGNISYTGTNEKEFAVLKTISGAIKWKVIAILPNKQLHVESNAFLINIIIYAIIIAILSILWSVVMSENIVKNIRKFNENLNQLGQGDLTAYCTVTSNDEIAEMCDVFNDTIENIRNLIKSTQNTCSNLLEGFSDMSYKSKENTQAINLIVESIQEIADGASQQASETTRMVNHFGELAGAMKYIDKSIVEVNDMVTSTQESNQLRIDAVTNLLESTNVNNESTDKIKKSISEINSTSLKIDTLINTIGEIANGNPELSASITEVKSLMNTVKTQTVEAEKEIDAAKKSSQSQTNAVTETRKSFDSLNEDIAKLNTHVRNIGVLNNNMILIKNTMTEIVDNLATKADLNSEATQSISAMTEEQLATMLEIDEHLSKLTKSSNLLRKEISKFKTNKK